MQSESGGNAKDAFTGLRRAMVAEVAAMAEEFNPKPKPPALSPAVLAALERVPRHRFVPEAERDLAYRNRPLPIGCGQTISQPYIVALMTDMLALSSGSRVLEIGTGCGYQTAVLAEMGAEVYSVEIVESLAAPAAALLQELGYAQVHVRRGDGYHGWPEHAPYDGIIVTAGADRVPQPLVDQLKPGGRLAIPVGAPYSVQELLQIVKDMDGATHSSDVLAVRFVPLIREH